MSDALKFPSAETALQGGSAVSRRRFMHTAMGAVALAAIAPARRLLAAEPAPAGAALPAAAGPPFGHADVEALARTLAAAPYEQPPADLPADLAHLNYEQYRDIAFLNQKTIWLEEALPFRLQLLHRGFFFNDRVDVATITGGAAIPFAYDPDLFWFGDRAPQYTARDDIGFSGLRLSTVLRPELGMQEFLVFQGASYLRAVAVDQIYGLSARALCIRTAAPEGEEFPAFRRFWLETPAPGDDSIVIHALLDSPSVAGAFRFAATPGAETVFDVEATLFPRVDLTDVGLAPATSMFFFGANGRTVDDYRPEVHDSDGLLIVNGAGERLWRPLANPRNLEISAFLDDKLGGFGLIQRDRAFGTYQDLEARYEKRPSLWIEPLGDWGAGAVKLIEIPTGNEFHDNIVAFWSPRDAIPAGSEFRFAYRMTWGNGPPPALGGVVVRDTRSGRAWSAGENIQLVVVDFGDAAGAATGGETPKVEVTATGGAVTGVTLIDNVENGGWRMTFQLDPGSESVIELRAALAFADGRPSEVWMYRWTPA